MRRDAGLQTPVWEFTGYTGCSPSEELDKPPIEFSYLPKRAKRSRDVYSEEPYFYLMRRPCEMEDNTEHNLVSVGGPALLLEDIITYTSEHPYDETKKRY